MAKCATWKTGPVLPYELIELIIALVSTKEDIETLLSLALLNYHFCWVARRYIFSYIPLEAPTHQGPTGGQIINEAEFFKCILYHTPKIASFVRKFDYVNDLQNKRHAPAIFKRLYNVTSFTFGFNDYETFGPKQADWTLDVAPAIRRGVCSFLHANDLRSLQLLNVIKIPGSIFELLPCLETLDLHAVTFSAITNHPTSAQVLAPVVSTETIRRGSVMLKSLTLRRKMEEGFTFLVREKRIDGRDLIDYSQVTTAHFHIDDPRMTSVLLEFLKETTSLTELTVGGYCGEFDIKDKFTSSLNPSSCRTLRSLEFWYMVDGRQYDPFGGLAHELADLAFRTRGVFVLPLEEVTVSVQIDTDSSCDTSPETWSKLDTVLSEPGSFPCLRKVTVKVSIYYIKETLLEALISDLRIVERVCFNGLKELQTVRGLDFEFEVTKEQV